MNQYKLIKSSKGTRYLKDGKLISVKNIPEDVLRGLETENEVKDKRCLFCDRPATKFRLFQLQPVDLCDEDYMTKTLGKIAQKLRDVAEPNK